MHRNKACVKENHAHVLSSKLVNQYSFSPGSLIIFQVSRPVVLQHSSFGKINICSLLQSSIFYIASRSVLTQISTLWLIEFRTFKSYVYKTLYRVVLKVSASACKNVKWIASGKEIEKCVHTGTMK